MHEVVEVEDLGRDGLGLVGLACGNPCGLKACNMQLRRRTFLR